VNHFLIVHCLLQFWGVGCRIVAYPAAGGGLFSNPSQQKNIP
jgi:hypothetical protein